MPTPVLKHKQALYEIFTAAMEAGQPLFGYCDGILRSPLSRVPAWDTYIMLAEFSASEVAVGMMNKKFRVIKQDIGAVAPIPDAPESEELAETSSFELARLMRTVLANNRTLVSESYPDGIAIESGCSASEEVFVVIQDLTCCVQMLTLEMKVKED